MGIPGRGVPSSSPNLDHISDQKMSFSTAVFKPGVQNPHLFSDLEEVSKCNIQVYIIGRNYVMVT